LKRLCREDCKGGSLMMWLTVAVEVLVKGQRENGMRGGCQLLASPATRSEPRRVLKINPAAADTSTLCGALDPTTTRIDEGEIRRGGDATRAIFRNVALSVRKIPYLVSKKLPSMMAKTR
jgi:hypothetical protein